MPWQVCWLWLACSLAFPLPRSEFFRLHPTTTAAVSLLTNNPLRSSDPQSFPPSPGIALALLGARTLRNDLQGRVTLPGDAPSSEKKENTPLEPWRLDSASSLAAWVVVFQHQRPLSMEHILYHGIRRGRPSDRILFAGYMKGDLQAPYAGGIK